jgi:hypothetical protein
VTSVEPPEERRDEYVLQHVAQVWAEPIADLDPAGLFRLGAACLDAADETDDAARSGLLASVAYSLLAYAGSREQAVGADILKLCEREQQVGGNNAETSRVIGALDSMLRRGVSGAG